VGEPYAESAYNGTLPVVIYYYSSKCTASKEVAPLIAEVEAYFNGTAKFREYDVITPEGLAAYNTFATQRNITKRYVPLIRMDNLTLTGLAEINRSSVYNSLFAYINGSDGQ
jgi:thiol-disulfide isomerase/thioredoxin